jgi:hypothetical protein
MFSRVVECLVKPKSWHALSSPCRDMPCRAHVVPWHGLSSLILFLLCIFQDLCRGHCVFFLRDCLVPISRHALCPCRGMFWLHALSSPSRMACLVKPKSYGMPCQAHVVTWLVEPMSRHACLVPMSWHVKPFGCMPTQAQVVACLVKAMS